MRSYTGMTVSDRKGLA